MTAKRQRSSRRPTLEEFVGASYMTPLEATVDGATRLNRRDLDKLIRVLQSREFEDRRAASMKERKD